jgi:hypothetical protein
MIVSVTRQASGVEGSKQHAPDKAASGDGIFAVLQLLAEAMLAPQGH